MLLSNRTHINSHMHPSSHMRHKAHLRQLLHNLSVVTLSLQPRHRAAMTQTLQTTSHSNYNKDI